MADISKCQKKLLKLAEEQGYLTFDDILNASDAFSLSASEVDILSESIQLRGIIVYEYAPTRGYQEDDEEILDYSRTDYDALFTEILEISPQLESLISNIKVFPPPQYGEINQLAMQVAEGNQFARERMISIFMRNVLKIALSMTKQYELELEDAISSGFIGLITAVDRYDPSGFAAFHSYASLRIQQNIQRDCNPTWIDFYFPAYFKEKMLKSLQKYKQYTAGEDIGTPQYFRQVLRIARELELSELDVDNAIKCAFSQKYGKLSVEEQVELECFDEAALPSTLIRNEAEEFEKVFYKDLCTIIEKTISSLTDREAMVIRMRYGIGYQLPMTLEEIGVLLNITRERVRQIEDKAMKKLLRSNRKKMLEDIL